MLVSKTRVKAREKMQGNFYILHCALGKNASHLRFFSRFEETFKKNTSKTQVKQHIV